MLKQQKRKILVAKSFERSRALLSLTFSQTKGMLNYLLKITSYIDNINLQLHVHHKIISYKAFQAEDQPLVELMNNYLGLKSKNKMPFTFLKKKKAVSFP